MKKLSILLAIYTAGFTAVFGADRTAVTQHCQSYHNEGKAVVEMVLTRKLDAGEVEKRVSIMVSNAVWTAGEYAKAFPKGEKLLAVVTGNVEAMKKLSFKELEHEWHDLHHFSKAGAGDIGIDIKAEENEHFTDPIHSIVHPLLVLKAAQDFSSTKKEEFLKSIKEEMEEGLEQMEKCRDALLKK